MKRHVTTIIAIGIILSATTANADWRYTKWGMTTDQVVESSKGKAHKVKSLTREHRQRGKWVRSTHDMDGMAFNVVFRFDPSSGLLHKVDLKLKNNNRCDDLVSIIKTKHPESTAKKISRGWNSLSWSEPASNMQVRFVEGRYRGAAISCVIEYTAAKAGG